MTKILVFAIRRLNIFKNFYQLFCNILETYTLLNIYLNLQWYFWRKHSPCRRPRVHIFTRCSNFWGNGKWRWQSCLVNAGQYLKVLWFIYEYLKWSWSIQKLISTSKKLMQVIYANKILKWYWGVHLFVLTIFLSHK